MFGTEGGAERLTCEITGFFDKAGTDKTGCEEVAEALKCEPAGHDYGMELEELEGRELACGVGRSAIRRVR